MVNSIHPEDAVHGYLDGSDVGNEYLKSCPSGKCALDHDS